MKVTFEMDEWDMIKATETLGGFIEMIKISMMTDSAKEIAKVNRRLERMEKNLKPRGRKK